MPDPRCAKCSAGLPVLHSRYEGYEGHWMDSNRTRCVAAQRYFDWSTGKHGDARIVGPFGSRHSFDDSVFCCRQSVEFKDELVNMPARDLDLALDSGLVPESVTRHSSSRLHLSSLSRTVLSGGLGWKMVVVPILQAPLALPAACGPCWNESHPIRAAFARLHL